MAWYRNLLFTLLATALLLPALPVAQAYADVELKVLDPRAELWAPPATPIQPRLSTLNGKKIAIINNTKPGADAFRPYLEKIFKDKFPTAELKHFVMSFDNYPTKNADRKFIEGWADAVIGMMGD